MKFVKKPIPIDAIRWEGNNLSLVKDWVKQQAKGSPATVASFVKRRGGGMTEELWKNIAAEDWGPDISAAVYDYLHETWVGVKTGQWIMCGTEGEFYPCADDGTGHAPMNYMYYDPKDPRNGEDNE